MATLNLKAVSDLMDAYLQKADKVLATRSALLSCEDDVKRLNDAVSVLDGKLSSVSTEKLASGSLTRQLDEINRVKSQLLSGRDVSQSLSDISKLQDAGTTAPGLKLSSAEMSKVRVGADSARRMDPQVRSMAALSPVGVVSLVGSISSEKGLLKDSTFSMQDRMGMSYLSFKAALDSYFKSVSRQAAAPESGRGSEAKSFDVGSGFKSYLVAEKSRIQNSELADKIYKSIGRVGSSINAITSNLSKSSKKKKVNVKLATKKQDTSLWDTLGTVLSIAAIAGTVGALLNFVMENKELLEKLYVKIGDFYDRYMQNSAEDEKDKSEANAALEAKAADISAAVPSAVGPYSDIAMSASSPQNVSIVGGTVDISSDAKLSSSVASDASGLVRAALGSKANVSRAGNILRTAAGVGASVLALPYHIGAGLFGDSGEDGIFKFGDDLSSVFKATRERERHIAVGEAVRSGASYAVVPESTQESSVGFKLLWDTFFPERYAAPINTVLPKDARSDAADMALAADQVKFMDEKSLANTTRAYYKFSKRFRELVSDTYSSIGDSDADMLKLVRLAPLSIFDYFNTHGGKILEYNTVFKSERNLLGNWEISFYSPDSTDLLLTPGAYKYLVNLANGNISNIDTSLLGNSYLPKVQANVVSEGVSLGRLSDEYRSLRGVSLDSFSDKPVSVEMGSFSGDLVFSPRDMANFMRTSVSDYAVPSYSPGSPAYGSATTYRGSSAYGAGASFGGPAPSPTALPGLPLSSQPPVQPSSQSSEGSISVQSLDSVSNFYNFNSVGNRSLR